jgi:hypothetical protein
MRLVGLGIINGALRETGARIVAMVDRLPLSMGIFGTTYNRLLYESWTNEDSQNGFKSILCMDGSENAPSHRDRLHKFEAYSIEEKGITWEIMQRNGRTKSENAQIG